MKTNNRRVRWRWRSVGAGLLSGLVALVLLGAQGGTAPVAAQSAIEYALLVAKAGGASQPAEPLGAALDNALNNLALDAGEATGAPEAASAGHAGEPVHPEPVEEISDMKAEADLAAPQEISPADEEPEDTVENAGSSESVLAGQVGEDE